MTYNSARNYVKNLNPAGIVPGLDAIKALCSALGNPQTKLKYIHIAGTNGKGSVGAFTESILISSGITVCRFASPAVGDYLESFIINGRYAAPEVYTECIEKIASVMPKLRENGIYPTSFEAETAAALLMFTKYSPDYVIMECGMGGKLDCTNIIPSPSVCVITPISYDHRRFLGETLTEITQNKAGIIKRNATAVTSYQEPECMSEITDTAKKYSVPLYVCDDISDISYYPDKTTFQFENNKYEIHLIGAFQPQNAVLAIKTAQLLGITEQNIRSGLAATKWDYRFERIGKYILDGAHNEGAAARLAESLMIYTTGRTAFICGCFKDKDYEKIVSLTAPYADAVYCVMPPTDRALDSAVLAREFGRYTKNVYNVKNMDTAIRSADRENYDNIVIFGSLSILSEAKNIIGRT